MKYLISWVENASNTLRPKKQTDYKVIYDTSITETYDSGAHLIESNPRYSIPGNENFFIFGFEENLRCGSDVLRVAANVIGQCSAKKCRFKCVEAGKRPNQRNAKCKKNLYWKVKYREISCDYIVKN